MWKLGKFCLCPNWRRKPTAVIKHEMPRTVGHSALQLVFIHFNSSMKFFFFVWAVLQEGDCVCRAPGHAQSSVRGFTAIEEGQGRLRVLCNAWEGCWSEAWAKTWNSTSPAIQENINIIFRNSFLRLHNSSKLFPSHFLWHSASQSPNMLLKGESSL